MNKRHDHLSRAAIILKKKGRAAMDVPSLERAPGGVPGWRGDSARKERRMESLRCT